MSTYGTEAEGARSWQGAASVNGRGELVGKITLLAGSYRCKRGTGIRAVDAYAGRRGQTFPRRPSAKCTFVQRVHVCAASDNLSIGQLTLVSRPMTPSGSCGIMWSQIRHQQSHREASAMRIMVGAALVLAMAALYAVGTLSQFWAMAQALAGIG